MIKKSRWLMVVMALAMATFASTWVWGESSPAVYVSNTSIGNGTSVNGVCYVSATAFARAAKASVDVDGSGHVIVNGQPTTLHAVRGKEGWLIPLQVVAQSLGYQVKFNKDVNVVDVYRTVNGAGINAPPPVAHKDGAPPPSSGRYKQVNPNSGGLRILLERSLVRGKTNIVVFYSKFSEPSTRLAPLLEKYADEHADVVVLNVNVNRPNVRDKIDWTAPIFQQYELNTLPNILIYDEQGEKKLEGDEAYKKVLDMIQAPTPSPSVSATPSPSAKPSAAPTSVVAPQQPAATNTPAPRPTDPTVTMPATGNPPGYQTPISTPTVNNPPGY